MKIGKNIYMYGLPFSLIIVLTLLGVIILQTSNSYAQSEQTSSQHESIQKDLEGVPDNTLTMIESNLKAGLGTVIRPHVTDDNRIIVLRQQNIPGGTEGTFFVQRLKYLQIQRLDAGWWQKGRFKALYVPTIEELCDDAAQFPPLDVTFAVDYQEGYAGLAKKLVLAFSKYDMTERVVWYNIPDREVKGLLRLEPAIKLGYYVTDRVSLEVGLRRKSSEYLLISIADKPWIALDEIKKVKALGKKLVAVLTSAPEKGNLAGVMGEELKKMGFNEVVTDFPSTDFTVMRQAALREIAIFNKEKRRQSEIKEELEKHERVGNMVRIPAGTFMMGTNSGEGFRNELPYHRVYLDEFYIDVYEVTVMDYVEFLNTGDHDKHYRPIMRDNEHCGIIRYPDRRYASVPGREDYPVTYVTWEDATAYAKWAGKRLPTEAEWEKAARGGLKGRKYPRGGYITQDHVNYSGVRLRDLWKTTSPTGAFPSNGYGLHDMCGNVWEWVQDLYHPSFYKSETMRNPVNDPEENPPINMRIIRGGSWADENEKDSYLRCSARGPNYPVPENWDNRIGFRCASSTRPDEEAQERANLDYLIQKLKESNPDFYEKLSTDSLRSLVLSRKYKRDYTYDSEIISMRKAISFSAVLPGTGEFYTGRWYSGMFFMAAEILGWYSYLNNNSKAEAIDTQFRSFADRHFDRMKYEEWLDDYLTAHFGEYPPSYAYIELPQSISVVVYGFGYGGGARRGGHTEDFYNRICNYDQFLAGWDDFDEKDGKNGSSENRDHFRSVREFRKRQHDQFSKRASLWAMFIVGNHLTSVIDTIWGIKRHSIYRSQGWSWDMDYRTFNGQPLHSMNVRYRW